MCSSPSRHALHARVMIALHMGEKTHSGFVERISKKETVSQTTPLAPPTNNNNTERYTLFLPESGGGYYGVCVRCTMCSESLNVGKKTGLLSISHVQRGESKKERDQRSERERERERECVCV